MKGRIDLSRFAALTATNHAKLYGLYPQKGTIAVGSDADLTLWNPEDRRVISNGILNHGADYTPYEGLEVQGWPVTVILHGKIAIQDGIMKAKPEGRYLRRKRSPLVSKGGWQNP
jgi:dihydropyrimidinase